SEKFQTRLRLTDAAVFRYAEIYQAMDRDEQDGAVPNPLATVLPPVDVADVNGALILVDGFHRVRAAEHLNWQTIPATIRPLPSIEEAEWQGGKINYGHGVSQSRAEHVRLFKKYVRAGHHYLPGKPHDKDVRHMKSLRAMGKEFAVSHARILRW